MLKYYCLYIFTFISIPLFAQKEAANWVMASNFWLDFNINPTTQKNSTFSQVLTETSPMSDSLGNLLFVTGALNKTQDAIINKNGDTISTIFVSSQILQNKLAIPYPKNIKKYFVFSAVYNTNVTPNKFGCYYAQIDMHLNNGLGGVITGITNILFNNDTIITVAGIKHSDCINYWLILRSLSKFYVYLINSSGLNLVPQISVAASHDYATSWQTLKVNPQGNKIAETSSNNQINCYDFNSTTGIISNANSKNFTGVFNTTLATEFSPDGSKLYFIGRNLTNLAQLYQATISNGNIDLNNSTLIYTNINSLDLVALQTGIDGKIYISSSNVVGRSSFLSVISMPNLTGANCNFTFKTIIAPINSYLGSKLPNFVSSYFKPQALLDYTYSVNCQSAQFILNDNSIQSVLWNFGDNQTSILLNPIHTYSNADIYSVTLSVTFTDNTIQTITKQITINPQPQTLKIVHK